MMLTSPIAHSHDPETSHEAAELMTASGRRERHAEIVMSLVRTWPGMTACELWERATAADRAELKEMQRIRQRLSDMSGIRVKQVGDKICTVRGTRQVTWYPIESDVGLFG